MRADASNTPSNVATITFEVTTYPDLPDGTMKAMVKRLIRSTERSWRVRQFNELKDFDLLLTIWTKAYRITEKRED